MSSSYIWKDDAAAKLDSEFVPVSDDTLFRSKFVDGEDVNVRLLERILQHRGFTNLSSTTDSRPTVALFQQVRPDLILTDWLMPNLEAIR